MKHVLRVLASLVFGRFRLVPNRVLFRTFQGEYCCNPKYITEELVKRPGLEIIWALNENAPADDVPPGVKIVRLGSAAYIRAAYTAGVWCENGLNFVRSAIIRKRRGQTYFQPMHGSLGLKRQGLAAAEIRARADELTDYVISNSIFENEVYRTSYWPTAEILECGHPRNDLLVSGDAARKAAVAAKVRSRLGVAPGVHLAIYAPTFRPGGFVDSFDLDCGRFRRALAARFGGEWLLLFRLHKRDLEKFTLASEGCLDVGAYPDIQELLVACDAGVTDYSSWICDFMLGGAPGFIYASDLERYSADVGFYYPLESTPFPVCTTNDALEEAVESFSEERYKAKCAEFLKERGCFETGRASAAVADKIVEAVNAKGRR
ncbi:MAG: CDP-glycerol glycerophosphotransferase family protein [Kiritimatiellae bacterium]|nr:CDP-glycerol glycerophosphotransferase family protein [Kiritimatiellia bacterium]